MCSKMLKILMVLICWTIVALASPSSYNSNTNEVPTETYSILPMVINTWNYTEATVKAWNILKQSKGGLNQTRNAIVEGITQCEKVQCDIAVGYGGSPDESGNTTLDAMVMDGATMNVGAVAGLRDIRDAIRVARLVLEHTKHSFLLGDSASEFAQSMGYPVESLITPASKKQWQKWQAGNCQPNFRINMQPDPRTSCGPYKPLAMTPSYAEEQKSTYTINEQNHDTIGMIAIDANHQIHVGTSTNGLNFKIPGRMGDTPIPGAGAYADNEVGAAVATGNGDIMMRFLPSHLAVEFMRNGKTPAQAVELVMNRITKHYKTFMGAIIAADRLGHYAVACYGAKNFAFVISNPQKTTSVETVKCMANITVGNEVHQL